ncbi:hypothetical protein [Kutzneria sp. NPDC052558]|uniref:hypothetical protein n=1 Tax=Kutzneria sp. NPDC052558 TaxID=3364121 RepID=UPI0037C6F0CD
MVDHLGEGVIGMWVEFQVGIRPHTQAWPCAGSTLAWIQRTAADHVQDTALAARLRELADAGPQSMHFYDVEPRQVPEFVEALADVLLSAAEREHDAGFVLAIRELVDLVTTWRSEHVAWLTILTSDKAIADSRPPAAVGATVEEVLFSLRADGYDEVRCLHAVRELTGCDLGEADRVVRFSRAWADRREFNLALQATFVEALETLAAESGSAGDPSGE